MNTVKAFASLKAMRLVETQGGPRGQIGRKFQGLALQTRQHLLLNMAMTTTEANACLHPAIMLNFLLTLGGSSDSGMVLCV